MTRGAADSDGQGEGPKALRAWVILIVTGVFILGSAAALWFLPGLLLPYWLPAKPTPADLRATILPAMQAILFAIGGLIAVFGVVLSVSRHRQELGAAARDRGRYAAEQERELRKRFVDAVELLADSGSATKRTAGMYALAGLADDWAAFGRPGERQVCIDVLCGYLRAPLPSAVKSTPPEDIGVKKTGISLIAEHLRDEFLWSGCSFNLAGMLIDFEVDLRGSRLDGEDSAFSFENARIEGRGQLRLSHLSGNGALNLRALTLAVDLQEESPANCTVDLSWMRLKDAHIQLSGLRASGKALIDLRRSKLSWTSIAMHDVLLTDAVSFAFTPEQVHGGDFSISDLRMAGNSVFLFDMTSYAKTRIRIAHGRAIDGAAMKIGSGTGIHAEPLSRAGISLSDESHFAVAMQFDGDATLVVDGVDLGAGTTLDLSRAVSDDARRVGVKNVKGKGIFRKPGETSS